MGEAALKLNQVHFVYLIKSPLFLSYNYMKVSFRTRLGGLQQPKHFAACKLFFDGHFLCRSLFIPFLLPNLFDFNRAKVLFLLDGDKLCFDRFQHRHECANYIHLVPFARQKPFKRNVKAPRNKLP